MTVLTGSSLDLGTAAVAAAVLTAVTLIRTRPGPPVSQRGEPVSRRSYPLIAAWSAASVLGDTALFKVGWNVMLTLTSPHSPLWWLLPALAASLISKQLLRVSLTQAVYATATQLESGTPTHATRWTCTASAPSGTPPPTAFSKCARQARFPNGAFTWPAG